MICKFLLALALELCLIAGGVPECRAQDYQAPQVTVSKEKVKMGGKLYYSHIVLEKQTIYSISKAYNVSIGDIYKANPGLEETGLKKNAVILIPDNTKDTAEEEKPAPDSRKKKKEKDDDSFTVHTVRWYEDLDVISKKYRVPVDVIMQENGLKGRKLKNRQKLRIPNGTFSTPEENMPASGEEETAEASRTPTEGIPAEGGESIAGKDIKVQYLFPKKEIDVALLLPLNAKDSTAGSPGNMDFYCGALLASKDLGDAGIDIDLSVYDVSDGKLPVTEERLRKSDVVIGPVSYGDLSRLMAMAPSDTYVVSPLDHRAEQLASSYRNFIQAPTSYKAQYEDLAEWIDDERGPDDKIILIYEKGIHEPDNIEALKAKIGECGMDYAAFSYSILEGRDILNSLKDMMTLTAKNHLLVASESEAFVNDVVRNANLLVYEKYDLALYASSKIRGFETIEVENLHNANLHVSTSYYIDYDRKDVQDFLMKYRALFGTEPTPFAFQGYDITRYFIEVCSKYGNGWSAVLPMEDEEMLQSGFSFSRVKTGASEIGYTNTAVRRIVYGPDYSVTLSKGL